MKRFLTILICLLSIVGYSQELKPTNPEFTRLQTPNNITFWYNPIDGFVWAFKGEYGWNRFGKWGDDIKQIAVIGDVTKLITLTKNDGSTLTATFTDNDNQILSVTSSVTTRTITISGGNSVGFDVADNDNSSTNEIQAPTLVGDNIGLTQTTTTISISGKEDKSNKVTSISVSSTDIQYPSAKLVYDQLATKEPVLIKGDLTESIDGLEFSDTRKVIGGDTELRLSAGYVIPTSVNVSHGETGFNKIITSIGVTGTHTKTISLQQQDGSNLSAEFVDDSGTTINTYMDDDVPVTSQLVSVTFPDPMPSTKYRIDMMAWYNIVHNGKSVRMINPIYDIVKDVNGFSFKVDTVAGYFNYLVTIGQNLYPLQFSNYINQSSITTTVSTPGSDLLIPTEKAVRSAFAPISSSSNYIWNNNSSAQSANMWISGNGRFDSALSVNNTAGGYGRINIDGSQSGAISYSLFNALAGVDNSGFSIYDNTNSRLLFGFNGAGSAQFYSTIQATTAKLINLTDGYIPYHISDASGLGNSNIQNSTYGMLISSNVASQTELAKFQNSNADGFSLVSIDRKNNLRYSLLKYSTNDVSDWYAGVPYNDGLVNSNYSIGTGISLSTSKFMIDTSGNVGIGYTSGSEITNNKLAVNGSGYFNGNINIGDQAKQSNPNLYLWGWDGVNANSARSGSIMVGTDRSLSVGSWDKFKVYTNVPAGTPATSGTLSAEFYTDVAKFYTSVNSTGYLLNGNNLHSSLSSSYIPYWDGTKFVNSNIIQNSVGKTFLIGQVGVSYGYTLDAYSQYGLKFYSDAPSAGSITFLDSGNVNISNLSGTGTRVVGVTSDGTLTSTTQLLNFDNSNQSNKYYSGIVETATVGENVSFGDVLYLKFSDGKWWKAKADAYATTPAARMALATISANSSGILLIEGNVRYDSWAFSANKIYLSEATAGTITSTQPSSTGNQIQVIGIAKTSTTIYFRPSYDVGEK